MQLVQIIRLPSAIRHIREKIEINPKEPRYLKVVWGVGYKSKNSKENQMTEKTGSFFKRFVGFLHFLFVCVTFVGIGFMYLNSNYGRGLDWIKTENFEQSPDFSKKVRRISPTFSRLCPSIRIFFESNGELTIQSRSGSHHRSRRREILHSG